jgi:hypothetical protein
MSIIPLEKSLTSPLPFRSIAWGNQATRGEMEALALEAGEEFGQAPRLPRGGVGASQVNPAFTLAMRERAALLWLRNAGRNPRLSKGIRERIKEAIDKADKILSGDKKAPKKKFDF